MNRRQLIIFIFALAGFMFVVGGDHQLNAGSNTLVIIANQHYKGDSISMADAKYIFQKEKERIGGEKVTPIHAKKATAQRKAFNEKVLEMTVAKEETYWQQKKVQSGKLPPKELANTIKAVSMVRGAIGYAFESEVAGNDTVKILLKI